jgi:hypothetical protein
LSTLLRIKSDRARTLALRALKHWKGSQYVVFAHMCRAVAAHVRGDFKMAKAWSCRASSNCSNFSARRWFNAARLLTRALYCTEPTADPQVRFSGLGRSAARKLLEMPADATFRLDAPMSTTSQIYTAGCFTRFIDDRGYMLAIEIPAGTHGFEYDYFEGNDVNFSGKDGETEFLLPAGTRLELTTESYEVEIEDGEVTVVVARVVGQCIPRWAL